MGFFSKRTPETKPRSLPLMSSVDVDGVLRRDYVLVDDTRAVEFERVTEGVFGVVVSLTCLLAQPLVP